jgi:acetyl-CoA/propionyl-CoA carboxylase biotin carboxyl carrier protein
VIEEAPSPLLESLNDGGATRARIGEAACQAARSVHYTGAGTVEFLVSDNAPDEFFFMEMNTRLQVEHPVTEMVTGVDLVEWQVRIAAGEVLTVAQDDVVLEGHAAEARVYAEVPERNFLPSSGTVVLLDERGTIFSAPSAVAGSDSAAARADSAVTADPHVRIDSSLRPGLEISSDYDPMLSKVIAWGPDRQTALDRMDTALERYTVLGVGTNVEYLRLLINDDDVRAGHLDTTLIDRKMPDLAFRSVGDVDLIAAAMQFWVVDEGPAGVASPWNSVRGWRLGVPAPWRMSFGLSGGAMATVAVTWLSDEDLGHALVRVNGGPEHRVRVQGLTGESIRLTVDGQEQTFALGSFREDSQREGRPQHVYVGNGGWSCGLEVLSRESRLERVLAAIQREVGVADPEVRSPMPGTVVSVSASDGETVEAGRVLLSVEAMKMEHQLVAEVAGTVHITVRTGDLVKADQVLATIHAEPAAAHQGTAREEAAHDSPIHEPTHERKGA